MTFKERYLAGEIEFEEIDSYISKWNFSDLTCTLREYLGLNAEEEDIWIEAVSYTHLDVYKRQV